MESKEKKGIKKLEIFCGIIALLAGIALVVFSCIDIPSSMMWQMIWGIVVIVMALIYFILYALSRRE